MRVSDGIQQTATARRLLAIQSLSRELDRAQDNSFVSRFMQMIHDGVGRPLIVSADIDGLVSASMLASVAPGWDIVALLVESERLLLHPDCCERRPPDLFGIDVFSPTFDNIGNHVVKYGSKQVRQSVIRDAYRQWDRIVEEASADRLMGAPSIWARTEACYEDASRPTSAKFKYPLGTAQLLLALLEAGGMRPRIFDREYLPWLIANCDGGVDSLYEHAYNAGIWWQALAGVVGPGSYTEQIWQRLQTMRLHDFHDAVTRLDRERRSESQAAWLDDKWKLVNTSVPTITRTLEWLGAISGWRDPVRGGASNLCEWIEKPIPAEDCAIIQLGRHDDPEVAAQKILGAADSLNANFYFGGQTGSRFNWVGGGGW